MIPNMENLVKANQVVLVAWGSGQSPESIKSTVERLTTCVGSGGQVKVENLERLTLSSHNNSTFDTVLLGAVSPAIATHTSDHLAELARILKPNGMLVVREPVIQTENGSSLRTTEKLISTLKITGFVNVSKIVELPVSQEELLSIQTTRKVGTDIKVVQLTCHKPAFEVGSSMSLPLSFSKQLQQTKKPKTESSIANVWTLSAEDMGDEDVDIIDSDTLLEEEDFQIPDPSSLRAECGPNSAKKKACKNCTCGFADEVGDGSGKTRPATSACGSCYLGDAFRCASCPYLGMPAFKPGEKISLSTRQLNPDL